MKSTPGHSEGGRRPRSRSISELTDRLRSGSKKITGPRKSILDVLCRHPHPLTNREIYSGLAAGECDLATVYRSIHVLVEMGMVQRFDFGDGVARFELVHHDSAAHHHHLICVRCSDVVEIDECFPAEIEKRIAERNGYKSVTHKLEFFGLCPACQ